MHSEALHTKPFYAFLHNRDERATGDTFYDPAPLGWTAPFTAHYSEILEEVSAFLNYDSRAPKPYFARELMSGRASWKTLSFYFWGRRMNKKFCRACPRTLKALSEIPGMVSASVSIMEPKSAIHPHFGDTNAIYRCHLGLVIPAGLPTCGIRVGYTDKGWETGQLLLFNDANYHKTWNESDQQRLVLIVDVIKPEYLAQEKWICALVYANIVKQLLSTVTGIFKGKRNAFTKAFIYTYAAFLRVFVYSFSKRKSAAL